MRVILAYGLWVVLVVLFFGVYSLRRTWEGEQHPKPPPKATRAESDNRYEVMMLLATDPEKVEDMIHEGRYRFFKMPFGGGDYLFTLEGYGGGITISSLCAKNVCWRSGGDCLDDPATVIAMVNCFTQETNRRLQR